MQNNVSLNNVSLMGTYLDAVLPAVEFKPGVVVQLKSDGPFMMVSGEKRTDDRISVEWFDRDGKVQFHAFDPENILVVHPDDVAV